MSDDERALAAEFTAPPTIPHYEPGPETRRMIERCGVLWEVTYYAARDGIGWLVNRVACRPIEGSQKFFETGDMLWIRVHAGTDFGPAVEVLTNEIEGPRKRRIHRSDIMHVERLKAAD